MGSGSPSGGHQLKESKGRGEAGAESAQCAHEHPTSEG